MKKEILLLVTMLAIIIVAITGWYMYYDCKNTKVTPIAKDSTFCSQQWVQDIIDIANATNQLVELKKISSKLCENAAYNECVLSVHTIDGFNFIEYAKDHPDNTGDNIVYYDLKLADLKSFIEKNKPNNCYDKHVNFRLAVNGTKKEAVPELVDYDETKSCYSIPLLSGIIEKNAGKAIVLKFCKAKIKGTERVIFSVDNNGVMVGYFDYTVKPMLDGPVLSSF